jgi:hypothetical protein
MRPERVLERSTERVFRFSRGMSGFRREIIFGEAGGRKSTPERELWSG